MKEQTTASQLSIGKSEASVKEQLNQLSATFTTAQRGMGDALVVLTTRVERIENARTANVDHRTDTRGSVGMAVGAIGASIGVLSLIVTVIVNLI